MRPAIAELLQLDAEWPVLVTTVRVASRSLALQHHFPSAMQDVVSVALDMLAGLESNGILCVRAGLRMLMAMFNHVLDGWDTGTLTGIVRSVGHIIVKVRRPVGLMVLGRCV